jgi:hypothetical protein
LHPQASEFPNLTAQYERMMANLLSSEQLPLKAVGYELKP